MCGLIERWFKQRNMHGLDEKLFKLGNMENCNREILSARPDAFQPLGPFIVQHRNRIFNIHG